MSNYRYLIWTASNWIPVIGYPRDHAPITPQIGACRTNQNREFCYRYDYLWYLKFHIMVNWQLSKQGIRWPVSHDYIAGSGVQPIEVTYFLKLTADHVMVFSIWSRARVFLNSINTKKWKGPLSGLAKNVLNILLSVTDWFRYLISEKSFKYASNSCLLFAKRSSLHLANFFMYNY